MAEICGSDLFVLLSKLFENKDIKRKLEVYADKLLCRETKSEFARHICPSDLIASVTFKLLTGKIIWDDEKYTLRGFFYSRINSAVCNLVKKEKKFIPVSMDQPESFSDYEGEINDDVLMPPQLILVPFVENGEVKEKYDPEKIRKIAKKLFKDSNQEFRVFNEMFRGLKSRHIALKLRISNDEVHNIKRRIIRALRAWELENKNSKTNIYPLVILNKNKSVKYSGSIINPENKLRIINKNGEII